MSSYTKLFSSILDSTVWDNAPPIKVVWVTMLAMSDRDGVVEASVPGLAKRAGVERGHCEQALALFMAPDPDSRTKAHEGRRIEEVEGGWRLLNHALYRERASADEQREKSRLRMAAKRARDAAKEQPVTPPVTQSSECHAPSPKVRHAEAEAEAEREQIQSERGATPTPRDSLARAVRVGFVERFERKHATTHEGPKGGDLAKILDAAEADRDPEGFVVAALDGFFASARMASQHPPHPVRFLAADIASWAADGRRHAPATPLHPDEAARRAKAEVDAANADWARRVGA